MSDRARYMSLIVASLVAGLAAVWVLPTVAAAVVVAAVILFAARLEPPRRVPLGALPAERRATLDEPLAIANAMLTPLTEGALLLDGDLTVLAANAAAGAIVGQPHEAMVGLSLIRATREYGLVEASRGEHDAPLEIRLSSGRQARVTTAPVHIGGATRLLLVEDVGELRAAQRARSDLVGNLSHELRTPVAAARALAETLASGVDDDDDRARFLGRLVEELERLGEMIRGMLRLARLESGSEPLAREECDVAALLQTAANRIEPVARARRVGIDVVAADGPAVRCDRERVLEALSNLLDNAVRHSPHGGLVRLSTHPDDRGVRVDVQDEGPGILPGERERVFERFYTGGEARDSSDGTGLGLAIARHIVVRHGGAIWVDDRSPGATLCFTLPATRDASSGPS